MGVNNCTRYPNKRWYCSVFYSGGNWNISFRNGIVYLNHFADTLHSCQYRLPARISHIPGSSAFFSNNFQDITLPYFASTLLPPTLHGVSFKVREENKIRVIIFYQRSSDLRGPGLSPGAAMRDAHSGFHNANLRP